MYSCPACKQDFDKILFGKCPHCKVKLRKVQNNSLETGLIISYALAEDTPRAIVTSPLSKEEVTKQDDGWVIIKQVGYTTIKQFEDEKRYIVEVRNTVYYGWVYCPGCNSKAFMNITLRGQSEHKCHKCKAVTTYVFN